MDHEPVYETDLAVGPSSIEAYSRLNYSMWYALAEFIDNSTQSRLNYDSTIDQVLSQEGNPLIVEIDHNRTQKTITIKDNSIGMTNEKLVQALRIAHPTKDSRGRSKYGMGMKTAACWIGRRWKVVTCEWSSGEEWTAEIDVEGIAHRGEKIPLTTRKVDRDQHYTRIVVSDLHRVIQTRTEDTIKSYLGSMYRFDLLAGTLKILYNGDEVKPPDDYEFDTDPDGKIMRRELPEKTINGKKITGWVAVLRKGGRKFGGFSLFQQKRQIQGYPNAWKPSRIFGGVDDEGANNLVSQRLTGIIELDGFRVSHTKDTILFEGEEEEELEKYLDEFTLDYRKYAQKRRVRQGQPWSRDKVKDLVDNISKEFTSAEMGDALNTAVLPPLETILRNNQSQLSTVTEAEEIATIQVTPEIRIIVTLQERSEYEPHLTITAGADVGTIHVIINGLHPYYSSLESSDAVDECIRQYIYDAIAEYKVLKLTNARVAPESVRRLKNELLRVHAVQVENAAEAIQRGDLEAVVGGNSEAE